ncbi:MAG: hypothetical protein IT437_12340 [Phycisphaerales bacterium]|nr:hypothetical protein [Phycisphaerales bacterium]
MPFLHTAAAATMLAALTSAASAQNLIYIDENGGGGNPRGLYTLDAGTGLAGLRATLGGAERFFGLDVQPGTGRVFATAVPGVTTLWTIDVNTGATNMVGSTGVQTMADITFDPATGKLYGLERNSPYRFYEVDPNTGGSTLLGTLNDSVRCGLTFAPDGTLYGFSTDGVLSKIDLGTLATAPIGGSSLSGGPVEDACVTPAGDLFFTLFGGTVYKVDRNTGNQTLIHTSGMGSGLLGIIQEPGGAPPCYPDCNGDNTLNLSDFGCFTTKFALGDPYADCNGDSVLNLSDFGCFTTKFALGCP